MTGSWVSNPLSLIASSLIWSIGYLFRATSGGVMQVAGLAPVEIPTVENLNVTELVPGHMAYRTAMPKLLREVGWEVESDEFTEIEDPDPENHEKRQRELINEIEEARKELEKKAAEKEKKGRKLSWWKRKKGDKKGWEVYDEHSLRPGPIDPEADPAKISENPIMFDIDAIRREIAMLAAESGGKPYDADERELEIKEIKSTLPPMKIELPPITPPPASPYSNLRETKSYNDSVGTATDSHAKCGADVMKTNGTHTPNGKKSFEEYDEGDAEEVEMTFETSFREPTRALPSITPSTTTSSLPTQLPDVPERASSPWEAMPQTTWADPPPATERPPLLTAKTAPDSAALNGTPGTVPNQAPNTGTGSNPLHNAWAEEFDDDFGKEASVPCTKCF
jgi:hypothetical protein